jgi:hypothetical protein
LPQYNQSGPDLRLLSGLPSVTCIPGLQGRNYKK